MSKIDNSRGQKLAAMLNVALAGKAYFDDMGDGTLINSSLKKNAEVNITIRSGEAGVAVAKMDKYGDYVGFQELGDFKWNDADGIVAALRAEFPSLRRSNPARRTVVHKAARRNPTRMGVSVKDGVLTYNGARDNNLVLREPGLPNLDRMNESELMSLWHATYIGGLKVARFLFPSRPKDYVNATRSIGGWASNKATAMRTAASGDAHATEVYESIADSIYRGLPAYARWRR